MFRRKRGKKKEKWFKVRFSGRFRINENQANALVASQLLRFCVKEKDSAKTELVFSEDGFFVGKTNTLLDMKKKKFYLDLILDFFMFKETPHCVIVVEKDHHNVWMSYVKFTNDLESEEFVTYLEKNLSIRRDEERPNVRNMTLSERIIPIFVKEDFEEASLSSYRSRTLTSRDTEELVQEHHNEADLIQEHDLGLSEEMRNEFREVLTGDTCMDGRRRTTLEGSASTSFRTNESNLNLRSDDTPSTSSWVEKMSEMCDFHESGTELSPTRAHNDGAPSDTLSMFCERYPCNGNDEYSTCDSE